MAKTPAQLDREIADALANRAASSTLADVRATLAAMGVVNSISERDNAIVLHKIVVPASARGSGLGTRAMQLLTAYADRVGKRIELTPSKDFGASSVARLVAFYKRFGFVQNKGRHRDFSTREAMIRAPR